MKNLIVTAHPDDSFIWAHTIRKMLPDAEWYDYVATYKKDTARGIEFVKACAHTNSIPVFGGYDDDMYSHLPEFGLLNTLDRLNITKGSFDNVFTHSPAGEYGHPHHIDVHNAVVKTFTKSNIWVFSLNYDVPDLTIYDRTKIKSPIRDIYEREMYIIGNFDMFQENFVLFRQFDDSNDLSALNHTIYRG